MDQGAFKGFDESSDGDPTDDLNDLRPNQQLSCPSCEATNFPNLSKLNKHRNSHDKPYKCPALGCIERFSQRQNLERHTQSKHGDTKNPTKFYHCTVDGCKYSSTNQRGKRFARADQVKEHIKDFGHYGPHSANDRPRRPGQPLFAEHLIVAHFEEWILDENALPRRTVQSYEYNSLRTKLWHMDDTGELYLRAGSVGDLEDACYWGCSVPDCYYQLQPPENLNGTVFKTLEGLQEHHFRAHSMKDHAYAPISQLLLPGQSSERHGGTSSLASIEPSTLLSEDGLPDLKTKFVTSALQPADGINWASFDSVIGNPFKSSQNKTTEVQQQTFQSIGDTSQICIPSISTTSTDLVDLHHSYLDSDRPGEENLRASNPNRSTCSTTSNESMVSRNSRISCEVPGCIKSFRRRGDMQRHVESVHRMYTRFTCSLCERHFYRKDKVNDHLKNAHKVRPGSDFMKKKALFTESSNFYGGDIVSGDALATDASSEVSWTETGVGSFPSPSFESRYSWQE